MPLQQEIISTIWIGTGATVVLDIWLIMLKRMGVPIQGFDLIGRWVGHVFRGKLAHAAIGKSAPVTGEMALGWFTHYATGIAFASVLVALQGPAWMDAPTLLPALAVGVGTVVLPFCVMQPAMGAGFASSNTPTPLKNRLRSLANHAVFGAGLYLAARLHAAYPTTGVLN